ncbi:MAG: hypothetical protein ABSE92_14220 [Terriglobales bacterium]
MYPRIKLLSALALGSLCAYGQQPAKTALMQGRHPQATKAENGFLIFWQGGIINDRSAGQVQLFNERRALLLSLDAFSPVRESRDMSIYDVSARPGGLIAVSAVYASKEGNANVAPASAILVFDFKGHLRSALALENTAIRLIVDTESRIWALTDAGSSGEGKPTLLELSTDGKVLREIDLRQTFPQNIELIADGIRKLINWTSMRDGGNSISMWLSGSANIMRISKTDGGVSIEATGLPLKTDEQLSPVIIAADGDLTTEVREVTPKGSYEVKYCRWQEQQKSWREVDVGVCAGKRLIGRSSAGDYLFMQPGEEAVSACSIM